MIKLVVIMVVKIFLLTPEASAGSNIIIWSVKVLAGNVWGLLFTVDRILRTFGSPG